VAISWGFLGFLEVLVLDIALFLELQAVVALWEDILSKINLEVQVTRKLSGDRLLS
jgi:hypothetical protein